MADCFNAAPTEGDGFTFAHLDDRSEAWVDFIADTVRTGGGGGMEAVAVDTQIGSGASSVTRPGWDQAWVGPPRPGWALSQTRVPDLDLEGDH
jgi:hypothetical protein